MEPEIWICSSVLMLPTPRPKVLALARPAALGICVSAPADCVSLTSKSDWGGVSSSVQPGSDRSAEAPRGEVKEILFLPTNMEPGLAFSPDLKMCFFLRR